MAENNPIHTNVGSLPPRPNYYPNTNLRAVKGWEDANSADIITGCLQYLPEILHDEEFIKFLCECIDFVLQEDPQTIDLIFRSDDMLLPTYTDAEAVNAYYFKFVYPLIGTRYALDRLLDLYDLDARIFEWYEYEPNLPLYYANVQFFTNPGIAVIRHLHNLLQTYRNERTNILRVFSDTPFCGDVLILSTPGYALDKQTMSIPTGDRYLNTFFCFSNLYNHGIDASATLPTVTISQRNSRANLYQLDNTPTIKMNVGRRQETHIIEPKDWDTQTIWDATTWLAYDDPFTPTPDSFNLQIQRTESRALASVSAGTGWASITDGYTHNGSATNTLTATVGTITVGKQYIISFTFAYTSGTTFTVGLGGATSDAFAATSGDYSFSFTATTTANTLTFTPVSTSFRGNITYIGVCELPSRGLLPS